MQLPALTVHKIAGILRIGLLQPHTQSAILRVRANTSPETNNPTRHAYALYTKQQSTHGIATTAADADDLDDAGTQSAVGHDGTGVVLVHGEDGAGRPVLAAEAGERSALRPPPAGQGRGEGFAAPVAGTAAAATAAKGNEQSRGRRGRGGCGDRGNRMGRRNERIGRPDGRRGQAGEGQDGHGSSRVHHLWLGLYI